MIIKNTLCPLSTSPHPPVTDNAATPMGPPTLDVCDHSCVTHPTSLDFQSLTLSTSARTPGEDRM